MPTWLYSKATSLKSNIVVCIGNHLLKKHSSDREIFIIYCDSLSRECIVSMLDLNAVRIAENIKCFS